MYDSDIKINDMYLDTFNNTDVNTVIAAHNPNTQNQKTELGTVGSSISFPNSYFQKLL